MPCPSSIRSNGKLHGEFEATVPALRNEGPRRLFEELSPNLAKALAAGLTLPRGPTSQQRRVVTFLPARNLHVHTYTNIAIVERCLENAPSRRTPTAIQGAQTVKARTWNTLSTRGRYPKHEPTKSWLAEGIAHACLFLDGFLCLLPVSGWEGFLS